MGELIIYSRKPFNEWYANLQDFAQKSYMRYWINNQIQENKECDFDKLYVCRSIDPDLRLDTELMRTIYGRIQSAPFNFYGIQVFSCTDNYNWHESNKLFSNEITIATNVIDSKDVVKVLDFPDERWLIVKSDETKIMQAKPGDEELLFYYRFDNGELTVQLTHKGYTIERTFRTKQDDVYE